MRRLAAALLVLALVGTAAASNQSIALGEVLGSWQGDDTVQFVELRMLADGQQNLSAGAQLVFDDQTASDAGRRFFTFQPPDPARGVMGAAVLIATTGLARLTNVAPDFVLPTGLLAPRAGRICYQAFDPQAGPVVVDCVAYGAFTAANGSFGAPTPFTPDDRSLARVAATGNNGMDWTGTLAPTPENNAGATATMTSLCGDGQISQGEECDGTLLGGKTCADLGFAKGTLACQQCHFDTSACTSCGDGKIDPGEQCDGNDVGDLTCAGLGFTGGTLGCTKTCRLTTASCDPTFFVPGGQRGPDCVGEWRITNAGGRPGPTGPVPSRQPCRDGDPGCDADTVSGTCTFTLAICLARDDARLAQAGHPCRPRSVESWTLLRPTATADPDLTARMLAAVAALGGSSSAGGTVQFSPPLDATERCTLPFQVGVPRRGAGTGSLLLRARTVGMGGRPRDTDVLRLVCTR